MLLVSRFEVLVDGGCSWWEGKCVEEIIKDEKIGSGEELEIFNFLVGEEKQ